MAINKTIAQHRFKQLRLLLELDTDVNSSDKELRTPLMEICFMESEKRAIAIARELLRRGGDISFKDKAGLTPLSHAILQNKEKLVAMFLEEAGNFDLNLKDNNGNTPLFHAATTGNFDILKVIVLSLRRYRLSVDIPNNDGLTPLMQASKMGHIFCARYLISEGKACKYLRDNKQHKTADEWQEAEGNKRVAENPMLFQLLPLQTKRESLRCEDSVNVTHKSRPMTAPGRIITSSYRDDLRKVYSVYERQLSSSYRPGCKPIIIKEPESPPALSETSESSDMTDFDSVLSLSLPDVKNFRRRGSTFKGLLPPGEGGDKPAFRRRSVAAGNMAELMGPRKLSISFPGSLISRKPSSSLSVSQNDTSRSKSPTSNGKPVRRFSMQTASTSIGAVMSSYTPRRGSLSVPKLRSPDQMKVLAKPSPSLKLKLHTLAEASDSDQENEG